MTESTDTTYLVRFPKDFPISDLAFAATRRGFRLKHVMPKDLRSRSIWEVITDRGEPERTDRVGPP